MFTGIIEEIGVTTQIVSKGNYKKLTVSAKKVLADLRIGDSISVNGVCLTVTDKGRNNFSVDIVSESLAVSNISNLRISSRVNLERSLSVIDRIGGHIVTGHIDGVGPIRSIHDKGGHFEYEIEIPQEFTRYIVVKGSIAIDGVSLTIAGIEGKRIRIAVIPHTLKNTILGAMRVGEKVNIELDIIGKYVESLSRLDKPQGVTQEMMNRVGFIPIGIVEN